MKFILQIIAIIIICFGVQYFLPWWTMAIAVVLISYFFNNKSGISFAAGFIGVGVLWLAMAFYLDSATESILTMKVNKLLPVNAFVLTSLIGALIGGLSSLSGSLLNRRKSSKYY
ncbi:MAG: hypothetical protein QM734_02580 [Cyclobacteriaceae bacterium]